MDILFGLTLEDFLQMGMTANVYQITPNAFLAIQRGDEDGLASGFSEVRLDLDKTWHAIHYLLTGSNDLGFLLGGVQLSSVSESFEGHSSEAISRLSKQVEGVSASALLTKYDAADFNAQEIYPGQWDETGPDYIRPYLEMFLVLIREAAKAGNGIAVVIA